MTSPINIEVYRNKSENVTYVTILSHPLSVERGAAVRRVVRFITAEQVRRIIIPYFSIFVNTVPQSAVFILYNNCNFFTLKTCIK